MAWDSEDPDFFRTHTHTFWGGGVTTWLCRMEAKGRNSTQTVFSKIPLKSKEILTAGMA